MREPGIGGSVLWKGGVVLDDLPGAGPDKSMAQRGTDTVWILKGRCDGFRYLSFISSSLNASVGVRHPRHFLGVPFKRAQIDFISRFESAAKGASLGK